MKFAVKKNGGIRSQTSCCTRSNATTSTTTNATAEAQRQFEEQKKALIAQILTTEARSRLANLKLTKPELVNQIEIQLIQSAQAGSLRGKVTDEQLKVLLRQIAGQKREIKITRK